MPIMITPFAYVIAESLSSCALAMMLQNLDLKLHTFSTVKLA